MQCTQISIVSYQHLDKNTENNEVLFDLQLFSGEKTEEATPKRKEEARKKGQVAKSVEVNSAFGILMAFLTLKVLGVSMYDEMAKYMVQIFSNLAMEDLTINTTREIFVGFSIVLLKTVLPVMGVILITALAVNFMQVGFMFSLESLTPSFDKINPISGFQRLFSKRSIVELIKSILKIAIVSVCVYRFLLKETLQVPALIGAELIDALKLTSVLIVDLVFQISAIMIVIAAIDYWYQWWQHNDSLKMSKQEIKEEYKQVEGDPQIKGKIKERQRAMAMKRMMQDVPKADVVVTNPTHFAVALKYEDNMVAPIVVAKGQDLIAQKIKEIAKEHKVVLVENKMLARALFASVEIGEIVPPELYQAVAEVLAYVYRLKKRLS